MNTPTPTPDVVVACLTPLLDAAKKTHAEARDRLTVAQAIPTGKRGRKDAIDHAMTLLRSAASHLEAIDKAIREATIKINKQAIADRVGVTVAKASEASPVFAALMAARDTSRRQIAIRDEKSGVYVHACVSFNRFGVPRHVELTRLATIEETVAQLKRWKDNAIKGKAIEDLPLIDAGLAKPEAFPLSAHGSSITVGLYTGDDAKPWGLNASTWRVNGIEEQTQISALISVAFTLREVLNAAGLPGEEDLYRELEGRVG
jgi:hypothetical protein